MTQAGDPQAGDAADEAPRGFSLRDRPEAPWALWSGVAGALATAGLLLKGIFSSASSTAVIGIVAVPFLAAFAAVPIGLWGAALGHVVLRLRGRLRGPATVLVAALAVAASLPAFVGREVHRGLGLREAVREALAMDGAELAAAVEQSPWREDRYFLGAVAQNPKADAVLLARIAALPDPALYEAMGSLWDVMGNNRKGLSVMRLVVRHANTDGATLARLADGPQPMALQPDLAARPRLPPAVLARWLGSTDPTVEYGLASNPALPRAEMERLARNESRYVRMNLTWNEGTPRDLLEKLAADADELVASNAAQALARRGAPTAGGK